MDPTHQPLYTNMDNIMFKLGYNSHNTGESSASKLTIVPRNECLNIKVFQELDED